MQTGVGAELNFPHLPQRGIESARVVLSSRTGIMTVSVIARDMEESGSDHSMRLTAAMASMKCRRRRPAFEHLSRAADPPEGAGQCVLVQQPMAANAVAACMLLVPDGAEYINLPPLFAIGASTGGRAALRTIVAGLPATLKQHAR